MATAALVSSDIDIGRRIIAALTRAGIPVTVYLWAFIPQLQEWQFMIATPLVDTKGPLAAYSEVNRVLQKAGVFEEVPLRRVFLRSPTDKVLRALEKESRAVPRETFRVVNDQIAGNFVEDAYVYSGALHIVRLTKASDRAPAKYSVIYTPHSGPGGAAPSTRFEGEENMRQFLSKKLLLDALTVETAIMDLSTDGNASIPNVLLNRSELRRLGLA